MDELRISETSLLNFAERFEQLRALFDVIEDELSTDGGRAYFLAILGRNTAKEASDAVGAMIDQLKRWS